jgi:hypothetical protein
MLQIKDKAKPFGMEIQWRKRVELGKMAQCTEYPVLLQFGWHPSVGSQHIYELKGGADKGKKQQTQAGIVFSS